MKPFIIISFFSLMWFGGCTTMSIYSDFDRSTNFKSFKTFAWTPQKHIHQHKNQKFDNDIVESNIQNLVNAELLLRGMRLDTSNPDVFIDYDIMTEKKVRQEQDPVYRTSPMYYNGFSGYGRYRRNNMYYNYGGWNNYNTGSYTSVVGYKTVNIPYQEGTLIIDIVDAQNNKLAWKGFAIGEVTDPETFEAELSADIHKMFKKYPVKLMKK